MKKSFLILAALAAVCSSCTKEIQENATVSREEQTLMTKLVGGNGGNILPGSVLVQLDAETAGKIAGGGYAEVSGALFGDIEVKSFSQAIPIRPKNIEVARKYGLDRWFNVEFSDETKPQAVAAELAKSHAVRSIQYNRHLIPIASDEAYPVKEMPVTRAGEETFFNDTYSAHQWNLHNDGTLDKDAVAGADIGVKDAWRLTGGDPSVIVAVLDRGIAWRHEDLKDAMWTNSAEINGTAGVDDDGNGFIDDKYGFNFVECFSINADYVNGKLDGTQSGGPNPSIKSADINPNAGTAHGCHVAGIIAATNNNGKGISSIAGGTGNGDGVRLMSCQVDNGKSFASDRQIALAYIYAADNGACIAQCSFGDPNIMTDDETYIYGGSLDNKTLVDDRPLNTSDRFEGAPLQYAALKYFLDPANSNHESLRGNIAVYAAGNDSKPYSKYPGALSEVISVTAVGHDMLPTGYTHYGPGCKIAAPGGEVKMIGSDLNYAPMILSTGSSGADYSPGVENNKGQESTNYIYMYGTSMACPHISGVLALGISYAQKLGKTFTREEMTSMLLTSVNDIDQYLAGGTKNSYVTVEQKYMDIPLNRFRNKMGTGLADAWKLLMAIEGTPSVIVEAGAKASIDISDWCSPSGNYTLSIDNASKTSLGLTGEPSIKNGKLEIECGKVGAGKIVLSSAVGKDPEKEDGIGSMAYSREISVVSREFATKNGGWL